MESPGLVSPNLVTFLVTLVNLGILFVVLRAILFKPVTKFMEDRAKKIQDTIDQAEKDKAQAKMLLQQYEEQLKKAGGEAETLIRSARESAREQADRIIAGGKAEAEMMLSNARKQIEAEQQAALARFRSEAAALVVSASARLIRRELNQEDNRRYAGMLLREIGNP
ncbi:MAG: F0F1 ATP synthase subunit B [Treponema sp.]|jgi:F-type H+-transporting ATPase subunit b|nr:F0F1 ATP synthase subunit B [Treponema sp.]